MLSIKIYAEAILSRRKFHSHYTLFPDGSQEKKARKRKRKKDKKAEAALHQQSRPRKERKQFKIGFDSF